MATSNNHPTRNRNASYIELKEALKIAVSIIELGETLTADARETRLAYIKRVLEKTP